MPDKFDTLFDGFVADGLANESDRAQFKKSLLAPGKQGYEARYALYRGLKDDGMLGDMDYNQFRNAMGVHATKQQSAPSVYQKAQGGGGLGRGTRNVSAKVQQSRAVGQPQAKVQQNTQPWQQPWELDMSEKAVMPFQREDKRRAEAPISPQTGKAVPKKDPVKEEIKDIARASRGDKEAAKRVGVTAAQERMLDEIDYYIATGAPLRSEINIPITAPTVARDENGEMILGEDGKPLVGVTTDVDRVAQYQQQEREWKLNDVLSKAFKEADKGLEARTIMALEDSENERNENPLMFALSHMSPQSTNVYQQQQEQTLNKGISPEALWGAVNSDNFIEKLLQNEEISKMASSAGMSQEEYAQKVLLPRVAEHYDKYLTEKYDIKGFGEYLMNRALGSMTGNILSGGVQTKGQMQMRGAAVERAHKGLGTYKPGIAGRLAGEVAMFAPDAPELMATGVFGEAAASAVGGGISLLGERLKRQGLVAFGRLASSGSPFLAANVGRATKWGGLAANRALGGTGLGMFMGTSGAIQDMNVGDGSLASIGKAFASGFAEGSVTGALLGVTNLGAQTGASRITGNSLASKASRAGLFGTAFVAENQLFANMDRFKEEDFDWVDSSMDAFYMQLAGKVASGHSMAESMKGVARLFSGKAYSEKPKSGLSWQSDGFRLNDSERAEIERAFGGTELSKIAANPENVGKILGDKQNISWKTRQKVSGSMGMLEPTRPYTESVLVMDKQIDERGANRELIETHTFETEEQKQEILAKIQDRLNDTQMWNDFAVLGQRKNVAPTQSQIENARAEILADMQKRDPKYNASNLEEGGADYQAVIDRANEKNNQANILVETVANDYGKTAKEVYDAMYKEPVERTFEEQSILDDLAARMHEAAYPEGEYHPSQSGIDAKKMVGDGPVIDPQVSAELSRRVDTATNEYNQFMQSHQNILEGVTKLGNVRPDEVLMFIADNYSGSERDEGMRVVSNYYNALAAKEAAMEKVADNIENYVTTEVDRRGFKGMLDGAPDVKDVITITDGEKNDEGQPRRLTLLNGEVGTKEDAASGSRMIDPDKSGGQIICRDENGEFVILKPDAKITFVEQVSKEDFANGLRQGLGVRNTQTVVETGLEKVPQEPTSAPSEEGKQQGAQSAVEAGREQTGADEAADETPIEVKTGKTPFIGSTSINDVAWGSTKRKNRGTLNAKEKDGVITFDIDGHPQSITIDGKDWVTSEEEVVDGQVRNVGLTKEELEEFDIDENAGFTVQKIFKSNRDGKWYAEGYFLKGKSLMDGQTDAVVELSPNFNLNDALKSFRGRRNKIYDDYYKKKGENPSVEGNRAVEVPTDDNGVKLYEQGTPIDDAIADIQKDGYDPVQYADLAISEAKEKLGEIEEPKTRADLVRNNARSKELQNIIDYYNALKEKVAATASQQREQESVMEASESEENVNVSNEGNTVDEKELSLQEQIASGDFKGRTADDRRRSRIEALKSFYGDLFDADFSYAKTAMELASMAIGRKRMLSRESLEKELGYPLGLGTGESWAETLLAKKGEGKTVKELAHDAWEGPENPMIDGEHKFDVDEIYNAILDLFRSAGSKSDVIDYPINSREEAAKRTLEGQKREAEADDGTFVPLTAEEIEAIESNLPFAAPVEGEDIPDSPITLLTKAVQELQEQEGTPEIKLVDTDRMTDDEWYDIASDMFGGAFVSQEDINKVRDYVLETGVFYNPEKGITIFSGRQTEAEIREKVQIIKDSINDRVQEKGRNDREDTIVQRHEEGTDGVEEEKAPADRADDSKGEERTEPERKPEQVTPTPTRPEGQEKEPADKAATASQQREQEEYLKPRNEKEKEVIKDVLEQLQQEIDAAVKERDKAASALEKARAEESDKATDLFSDDNAFKEEGQLFDSSDMPTDRSQEGVNKRTSAERERLNEAQEKLNKLQSEAEKNSRIRGALDNERKQTEIEQPTPNPSEEGDVSTNPVEAIEQAADEFKKEQDKEIGITHDETPEQKADRENAEKFADTPITADEIDGANISDVEKTLAKAYLNGNQGFLQKAAYLKAYDNVRNRRQDGTGDSLDAESGTQLDSGENQREPGSGRVGESTVPMDEAKGGIADEGQTRLADGKGQSDTPVGERGDRSVSGAEPSVDGLPSGGERPEGSRESGGTRRDVRGAESDKGGGKDTPKPAAGSDAAIAASKQRLAELRQRFKKAGRNGTVNVSLVGMNSEQIEVLMDITTEAANLGYQYLAKGVREFKEWNKQMLDDFHDWLQEDMKWSDAEINEYLNEVWNCEYNIDGVTRSIREWASLMGEKELRKVVKADRGSKFEAQKAAEGIEVKTGDIDNIRETLPFLLPEQQDDVLKAETQFFDESHQDREHGNGKGMMFTNGTGTGKTYTGLGIVKRFVKQGKGRVLILTPSQEKVTDWANDGLNLGLNVEKLDDIAKAKGTTATKSKGTGVVVTTYANARQNLALLEDCFDLIVYDESHKITEGKEAAEGEMYKFHQMLTNKDVEKSIDRQTYWLPEWIEYRNLVKEREENRKMLDNLDNYDSDETVKVDGNEINVGELRSRLNARMLEIENRFGELQPIMQEIRESKRGQAEIDSKRTKTVFLSATPFNTRENMKYAEGYLFSYPEEDPSTVGSYNHRSPEDAFLERYFPAGYRWRYGRLESHVSNAEALGRQEIDFSDYLQNQLGTLSGRMISSDYDYSRDFPIMTLDHAGRFNQAMSEVYRNKRYNAMSEAFRKSFDYNYSTALFEAMKTSLVIDRIKEHLKRGQKVVVFHRRRTSGDLEPPFEKALNVARVMAEVEGQNGNQKGKQEILNAVKAFSEDFADMLEWEKGLDYTLPRDQIAKVFGEDKIGFFSGAENKKTKHGSVEDFMKDNGGKDIIVIQEASGKEGISLHDQTGEHQRVEINLALPQSPIAFIQIEGRIYRIGQKSNAIFEYPLLGLDLETDLFAQRFNSALGTTENLALGSKARNLRKSIANSILMNTGMVDYDRQGLGGKDMDGQVSSRTKDGFDDAINDYYGNQKMQRGRANREGYDYFPTPEPVGFKMVEWGQLMEGESALEPSAGHGAIARYVPETNSLTAIEPSADLFSKLQLRAGGPGRRFEEKTFEDYPLANKHDVIVMNPPYGTQGKMAMEHVEKAFKHLNEGGRLIAIIPDGPAMEKRFDAWLNSTGADRPNGSNVLVGEVKLPDVAFGRAGTNVRTRIVVIDKVSRPQMREGMPERVSVDLSGAATVEDMFEELRHVNMPERTIDQAAIAQKQALKTRKSLEDNKFVRDVVIDEYGVRVGNRSSYGSVPGVRISFEQLDNPAHRKSLLQQVEGLIKARDNAENIDYGKWKNKTYGSGKNAVPAVEAIRDYCDTAIKTIANVLKTTPDALEKEIKFMKEEEERQRQEREAERQRAIEQREREHEEKVKSVIETALKENGDNQKMTPQEIAENIRLAHGQSWSDARTASAKLRMAGIDWETGHQIVDKVKTLESSYNEQMPLSLETMKHLMAIAETSINADSRMAAKRALEMSGIHSDTGEAKEGFDYSSHDEYYEKDLRGFLGQASPFSRLKTRIQEQEERKPAPAAPQPAKKESFEYKLDQNTKTGADMHLVVMNERVDDATYKDLQRKAKALNDGYYNRFKKAWHFKTEEDARKFMEQAGALKGTRFREEPAKKTPKTVFRMREDKLNKDKLGRKIPDDVEKSVSSQIEKDFDRAVESELRGLSEKERAEELENLQKKIEQYSVLPVHDDIDINGSPVQGLETRRSIQYNRANGSNQASGRNNNVAQQGNVQASSERRARLCVRAIDRELRYREARGNAFRAKYGIDAGDTIPLETLRRIFEDHNTDNSLQPLFDKAEKVLRDLQSKVRNEEVEGDVAIGAADVPGGDVSYEIEKLFATSRSNQTMAGIILHEMLHQGTTHAIGLYNHPKYRNHLSREQQEACREIISLYKEAKNHPEWFENREETYGLSTEYEFATEAANQELRAGLERRTFVGRLWDSIKKLFGFGGSRLERLDKSIQTLLDTFAVRQYRMVEENGFEFLNHKGKSVFKNWDKIGSVPDEDVETTSRKREAEKRPIFESNAHRAVESIKQEKATPEQWLKMIEKAGGLKAGEDKWMGLSEWLKGQDKKSLTKQEVLDFIRENQIQIEEVNYADQTLGRYDEHWDYLRTWLKENTDNPDAWYNTITENYGYRDGEGFSLNQGTRMPKQVTDMVDRINKSIDKSNPINSTRLSYTTKGLENKKEIALTVPTVESWNESDEVHFGDAGEGRAVAWVRFGETEGVPNGVDADRYHDYSRKMKEAISRRDEMVEQLKRYKGGMLTETQKRLEEEEAYIQQLRERYKDVADVKPSRVLVIDEIQSKRHQEGREKGYYTKEYASELEKLTKEEQKAKKAVDDYYDKLMLKYDILEGEPKETRVARKESEEAANSEEREELNRLKEEHMEAMSKKENFVAENGSLRTLIPDAPFEKNWHELAMKRMLRYAAENGYDKVAWTKGEQQAERYGLGNKLDTVDTYTIDENGKKEKIVLLRGPEADIRLVVDSEGTILQSNAKEYIQDGTHLDAVVGKELARKIVQTGEDSATFNGEDLFVGGEGMKGFYNQILPRFMDKYGKKWGVKTGEVELPNVEEAGRKMWSVDVTPEMKESVMQGQTMFKEGTDVSGLPKHAQKLVRSIEKTAKKLNTPVKIARSIDEVTNKDALKALREGRIITGWFEEGTGEIVLYLPNIADKYSAMKTVAHEVVGHNGLRALLGEEGYRSYMRTLWLDMKDESLSKYIKENYSRHGDIYTTIDEYLAEAAEKGYGKLPMWQKVRDVMTGALRKAGFEMTPSISDVKYMVWLSKHRLESGNPINAIERNALLHRLNMEKNEARVRNGEFSFGDEAPAVTRGYFPGDKTLFRSTPSAKTAKWLYEKALSRWGYSWKESHVDKMQAAVELMRAISGVKKIEDIPSVENFVLAENQMSSKEEQIDYLFNRDYMEPLTKAVAAVLPEFGGNTERALRNLQVYMVKKSGLERNRCLYVRDKIREYRKDADMDQNAVDQLEDDWNQLLDDIRDDIRKGAIDLREYLKNMDAFIRQNIDANYKADDHDYSGLTAMTGSKKGYDDSMVIDDVMDDESMVGEERIKTLWEKTKAVSQYGLDAEYEGGLDSKEKHDKVSKMFEWYVPMRGYDETRAEEVYDYLEENKGSEFVGPVLMNAKGRESLSNVDIFAQLGAMSCNAVHRALKNQMKQSFARFVRNHYDKDGKDRLVTELKYLWGEKRYDPDTGASYWEEVFPDIPENATADDVAKIVEDFENDMKAKEATGDAKRMRQNSSIPFRMSPKNKPQHIVEVYINGEKKTFIVNGNPRAAQAINGELNPETNHRVINRITRTMAQLNTSYNPDFVVGNTERDYIFSSAAILAKESPKYFAHWQKNYFGRGIARGVVGVPAMHTNLFKRYRQGNLDMSNPTDRYFKEFMENGGETGWVEQKNLEKWRKEIKKGVKTQGTAEKAGRFVINAIPEAIEAMNERAENAARFATYMTSRQMGRSITRSVSDAKEVSVNFNRKGAGLKAKDFAKNGSALRKMNAIAAARTAQYGQDYLMFYNAGVQGLNNAAKILRDHPMKASTIFAGFALGALLMSNLNQALIDDEDPKERGGIQNPYAELPEWIRRNRLCLYAGKGEFITVDLPIELRALYGIGDIAAAYTTHPELRSQKPVWQDVMTQITQILPVDFMGEHPGEPWMSFVPSFAMPFAEVAMNQNWYGRKIEKDQYVDENDPRWTRAYRNANRAYIDASKGLNAGTNRYSEEDLKKMGIKKEDVGNVDAQIKGVADGKITDPAIVEHIVNGYFGGAGQTAGRLAAIMKGALQGENIGELAKSPQMPIVRRLHYSPTEQNKMARTRNKWWHYKDEMDEVMNEVKLFGQYGVEDPISKMKQISVEDSVRATRASLMKDAQKQYKALKKLHDKMEEGPEKEAVQMRMDQLMENTVMGLDSIR